MCKCVCAGSSQCVEVLLAHGADPDAQLSHQGSPLYVSCLHQRTACSKILLHRGVFDLLHLSAWSLQMHYTVKRLLEHKVCCRIIFH